MRPGSGRKHGPPNGALRGGIAECPRTGVSPVLRCGAEPRPKSKVLVCCYAVRHREEGRSEASCRDDDPETVQFAEPASRIQVWRLHIAMKMNIGIWYMFVCVSLYM